MTKALIIIDAQKQWQDADSPYYVGELGGLVDEINRLLDFGRKNGYKIIFSRHVEPGESAAFREGSEQANFIDGLDRRDSDIVISKRRISLFLETDLEKELKNIRQVAVCGLLTNLCVRMFVEEAYDRDFDITVITDACRALDAGMHDYTLDDLKGTREEVEFRSTAEFTGRQKTG